MSTTPTSLPKDIAAAQGKVNVQINGTWYQFPKGMRIADACKSVGVAVPCFCYHPKLAISGSCRMCLVEQGMPPRVAPGHAPCYNEDGYLPIHWMPRPIIACANTVCENMGIRTTGKVTSEARRGVLEFFLTSHPLDCPICDQAGECKLQEFSNDYGQGYHRFTESKTKKGKNMDIGPRINLDQERCVLCGRCVRFMRDIAKDPVLSMAERGTENRITIFPGRQLDHNYSMNTVDLCPVGALTSKDFRFQMRVWFLKSTPTIDVNCGTGININVWTREETVYRITPRQNDEVNSCWMPDSHRLNYKYINSDQRLTQPCVRTDIGAPHRGSTWDAALSLAAEQLKKISPKNLAIIASARMTDEELYMVSQLAHQLGTDAVEIVPRKGENDDMLISDDRNPNTNGAKLILGIKRPGYALKSIREGVRNGSITSIIALGEDLTQEAGFTTEDLGKLDYLLSVGHTADETARHADIVLPGVTFVEKYGTMINVTGRIQRLNRAIMPHGESRDDWQILRDLTLMLGCDSPELAACASAQDVLLLLARNNEAFEGLTWGAIGNEGKQLIETGVTIPLIERERAKK